MAPRHERIERQEREAHAARLPLHRMHARQRIGGAAPRQQQAVRDRADRGGVDAADHRAGLERQLAARGRAVRRGEGHRLGVVRIDDRIGTGDARARGDAQRADDRVVDLDRDAGALDHDARLAGRNRVAVGVEPRAGHQRDVHEAQAREPVAGTGRHVQQLPGDEQPVERERAVGAAGDLQRGHRARASGGIARPCG